MSALFATCKKKDPPIGTNAIAQLPPITTTGANTFGCLVNGEVWLPKGSFPNFPGLHADYWGGVQFRQIDLQLMNLKLLI